jgi:hypothetical protein
MLPASSQTPSCGPLRCGPMFNCGICRTRTGQGMSLVDAVRPHPCVREGRCLSVLRPPQATSETLKGPSHSAHRELVDAVNDGNEECVAFRALRHASACAPDRQLTPHATLHPGWCETCVATCARSWTTSTRTCSCWRSRSVRCRRRFSGTQEGGARS